MHAGAGMAGKIFINYRRGMSLKDAKHLHAYLSKHFSARRLFIDLKGLDGGQNWLIALQNQVAASGLMLALIGPGWLDLRDEKGERRLDDRNDFVRFEISEAIRRGVPIIPILIDGAEMPPAEQLPVDMKLLTYMQGMPLRTEDFELHVDRIAARARELLAQKHPGGLPLWGALASLAAGVVVGPLAMTALGVGGKGGETSCSQVEGLKAERAKQLRELAQGERKAREQQDARIATGSNAPARKQGETVRDCSECPELVVVPAGSFTMGSPADERNRQDNEGPQHKVTIAEPFAVGKFAVTFAEWDACVADGGCGGYRPADQGWGRGRRPVINVSWDDAQAYVKWLSGKTGKEYRLLSEAEREYVARAPERTPHFGGVGRSRLSRRIILAGQARPCPLTRSNRIPGACIHSQTLPWT
jgi:hypothetical protein